MKTIKTIATILLVCMTVQANAWTKKVKGNGNVVTKNRTTADYEKIAVGGSFDVTLVAGEEGKLTIKIEDNLDEYLITEVKDGKLKIKWKKGINVKTSKGVKITVPFEQINAVTLGGSGTIKTVDVISSHELSIAVAGSGNMYLDVKTSDLNSSVAGSGNMTLNGVTTTLDCKIAGSGNFRGYQLSTVDANAKIAGSGNIHATINGKLTAKIAGSGSVKYEGNATVENVKISGSGSVRKK